MKRILARLDIGASIHKHHEVWKAIFSAAPSYLFQKASPFRSNLKSHCTDCMIVVCFLKPIDIARLGLVLDLVEMVVGAGDRRETWTVDQRCGGPLPDAFTVSERHKHQLFLCNLALRLIQNRIAWQAHKPTGDVEDAGAKAKRPDDEIRNMSTYRV